MNNTEKNGKNGADKAASLDFKVIILDGRFMYNRNATHKYIEKRLYFPEYYGENLDALHDLLTESDIPTRIQIINTKLILKNLKEYGEKLLEVFRISSMENKNLQLIIFDMESDDKKEYKIKPAKPSDSEAESPSEMRNEAESGAEEEFQTESEF